jgi:hypothetical protein
MKFEDIEKETEETRPYYEFLDTNVRLSDSYSEQDVDFFLSLATKELDRQLEKLKCLDDRRNQVGFLLAGYTPFIFFKFVEYNQDSHHHILWLAVITNLATIGVTFWYYGPILHFSSGNRPSVALNEKTVHFDMKGHKLIQLGKNESLARCNQKVILKSHKIFITQALLFMISAVLFAIFLALTGKA